MKKETERWRAQAIKDLKSAESLIRLEDYSASAFLSQQAVEKALKALLIERTDAFPRIHDVVELSKRVDAPTNITELCARVNPAYTATRYPDVAFDIDFNKDEVEAILNSAKEVLEWTKKRLES